MMRSVPYNVGSHSNVIGQDPLDRKVSERDQTQGETSGASKPRGDIPADAGLIDKVQKQITKFASIA
jgi:hypothetical protein